MRPALAVTPPLVPKSAILPPLSSEQSSLIARVATQMADLDELIGVALLSSEEGPFAAWLQKELNRHFLAVVQNFDKSFLSIVKDDPGFQERFRGTALLRRTASADPRKLVAAEGGAAAGAGAEAEEAEPVVRKSTSAWALMDRPAKIKKWTTFFQLRSPRGALRYQALLDFLVSNLHRLTAVNLAWKAYKAGPYVRRAHSLGSPHRAAIGAARALEPLVEETTPLASSASSSSLFSLRALALASLEDGGDDDTLAPLASLDSAYDADDLAVAAGGVAGSGTQEAETSAPSVAQQAVIAAMTKAAGGAVRSVGYGGVLLARAHSLHVAAAGGPAARNVETTPSAVGLGTKRPRTTDMAPAVAGADTAAAAVGAAGAAILAVPSVKRGFEGGGAASAFTRPGAVAAGAGPSSTQVVSRRLAAVASTLTSTGGFFGSPPPAAQVGTIGTVSGGGAGGAAASATEADSSDSAAKRRRVGVKPG